VAGSPTPNAADPMKPYSKPARVSEIGTTHNTILFADAAAINSSGAYTEKVFIYPRNKDNGTPNSASTANFHFLHSGRLANAAYCDGHVDSIMAFEFSPAGDGLTGWMSNEEMDRQ
jgi:prepilin-type processing-associated H-X9-DG protein